MSTIQKPKSAYFDKHRKLVKLQFPEEAKGDNGEYQMRGGICWPVYDPTQGSVDGFVLVAGQNLRNNVITVFEQSNFVSVDHVLGENGFVKYAGLSAFFNSAWTTYYANSYFMSFQQGIDINHRYRLQVIRSNMIEPKPAMIEVNIFSSEQASQVIFEKIAQNALRHNINDRLYAALMSFSIDTQRLTPPVMALAACLFGFEEMPYRPAEPLPVV